MIDFSTDLRFPVDAVTQTFGVIGRRGSGKSYASGVLAEGLLTAGAQTVILDPVGNWWGLRLAADGKGPGFGIPVFGGEHGDVPLDPAGGALVADVLVDTGTSAILDVSGFRKNERKKFVADFAEQLFHRKKTARSPLHLIIEEAQKFVPQMVGPDDARMVGALEDCVRLGRNYGIGVTLISQRPQSVNKEVLNQVECLVVLQLTGPQERKAIEGWVKEVGADDASVDKMHALPVGTAFVWSPQWLKVFTRVKVGRKFTYDASATPELGKSAPAARPLADLDLDAVRKAMAAVVERVEKDDPKALRRRIADLEAQLRRAAAAPPPPPPPPPPLAPVVSADQVERLTRALATAEDLRDRLVGVQDELARAVRAIAEALAERDVPRAPTPPTPIRNTALIPVTHVAVGSGNLVSFKDHSAVHGSARLREPPEVDGLKRGARAMLAALAARFPSALTRAQVATLSGLAPNSGTFARYLSDLRTGGYVTDGGRAGLILTAKGAAAVGEKAPAATTPDEILALWRPKLKKGAREMLDILVAAFPDAVPRRELGERAGITPSSGTFARYLSSLRTNGLAEDAAGGMRAGEALFS